jgi:phosphoserine phosphatase
LFTDLIDGAEYNAGVAETLAAIDRSEYELVLVSGGFRELARRAQLDFTIQHAFAACEYMFDHSGRLAAFNLLPCDFHGKIDFIRLMLREYALTDTDWVFVGDGTNDVPIAQCASVSIAYGSNPALKAVTTFQVDHFRELLPILRSQMALPKAQTVRK